MLTCTNWPAEKAHVHSSFIFICLFSLFVIYVIAFCYYYGTAKIALHKERNSASV